MIYSTFRDPFRQPRGLYPKHLPTAEAENSRKIQPAKVSYLIIIIINQTHTYEKKKEKKNREKITRLSPQQADTQTCDSPAYPHLGISAFPPSNTATIFPERFFTSDSSLKPPPEFRSSYRRLPPGKAAHYSSLAKEPEETEESDQRQHGRGVEQELEKVGCPGLRVGLDMRLVSKRGRKNEGGKMKKEKRKGKRKEGKKAKKKNTNSPPSQPSQRCRS